MIPVQARRWGLVGALIVSAFVLMPVRGGDPAEAAGAAVNVHRIAGPITLTPGKAILLSFAMGNDTALSTPIAMTLTFRNAVGGIIGSKSVPAITFGQASTVLAMDQAGSTTVDGTPSGANGGEPFQVVVEVSTRAPKTLPLCASAQLIDPVTHVPEGIIAILIGL